MTDEKCLTDGQTDEKRTKMTYGRSDGQRGVKKGYLGRNNNKKNYWGATVPIYPLSQAKKIFNLKYLNNHA